MTETAKDLAIRYLSRRAYSEQEIAAKLLRHRIDADEISRVIAELKEKRYLNDAVLCRNIYEQLVREGKYGLRAIQVKLRQRGFPKDTIHSLCAEYGNEQEHSAALQLVHKRFRSDPDAKKISRYLSNRGFAFSVIARVLNDLSHTLT